jgi:uncharacterized protein YbcI
LRAATSPEEQESRTMTFQEEAPQQPGGDDRRASVLASISEEMVRLYKEQFGRGPTRVRTYWCGDDIITSVLEETFTPAERNLAALGEHQRLRDTRMFFQYASIAEFCEPVERFTGRTVKAFISGLDTAVNGVAIETFVLYPAGADGPSRTELGGL